jgi:Protein kinase domain
MASYYTVPIGQSLNDVPIETGNDDVKIGDSGAIGGQVKTNKKQVSFNRHDELMMIDDDSNVTPASSLWNSARSADSNTSKDYSTGGGPISPSASVRSCDSSGNTSVSIPSLLSSLMRTHKHRDPYRYYEVLKVLGDGSMGSVSKVRKRKSAIGGSARKAFVEEESQHYHQNQKTLLHNCFSFCIPGNKEKKKENSFASVEEIAREGSSGSTRSALTSDSSYIYALNTGNDASINTSSEQERVKTSIQSSSSMISFSGESSAVYALKTIILDKVTDSTFRRELLNEVDILRSISHPNIVKALDFYTYNNRLYLVLELCSGGELYTIVHSSYPLVLQAHKLHYYFCKYLPHNLILFSSFGNRRSLCPGPIR